MLQASKITMRFGDLLFDDLSFVLGNNEKVGLVGLNGTGKSTLLKIISGELKPDEGNIVLQREVVGYLPQEFDFEEGLLVGEYYEILADELSVEFYEVQREVGKLDLDHIDEFTLVESLSPGQRMRLYLLRLILTQATILLLDEPTNHLDIDGIIWFEKYIAKFNGIAIIISHDREFLDNVVNTVFEIDEQQLYIYTGNYTNYIQQKQGLIEERAKLAHLHEKKMQQLERLLENSRKIGDGKSRGKAVRAAKKRMARQEERMVEKYQELKLDTIDLESNIHRKKRILQIKDLSFAYPEKEPIIEDSKLSIYGSQKIWFLGPNGIGKSTLIKIITGELEQNDGSYKWGENIRWRYFSQEQEHLPEDEELAEFFMKETGVDYTKSFGLLEQYLFPKHMRTTKIGSLSPGQRARLSFAIFSLEENDCLILDEPTNHLDINTKMAIEESLRDYSGALILVSHDRAFAKGIKPDRVITIEDKKLKEVF